MPQQQHAADNAPLPLVVGCTVAAAAVVATSLVLHVWYARPYRRAKQGGSGDEYERVQCDVERAAAGFGDGSGGSGQTGAAADKKRKKWKTRITHRGTIR